MSLAIDIYTTQLITVHFTSTNSTNTTQRSISSMNLKMQSELLLHTLQTQIVYIVRTIPSQALWWQFKDFTNYHLLSIFILTTEKQLGHKMRWIWIWFKSKFKKLIQCLTRDLNLLSSIQKLFKEVKNTSSQMQLMIGTRLELKLPNMRWETC
jgi:hypothetical protein